MFKQLTPVPAVRRMLVFAALSGFLIAPLWALLWQVFDAGAETSGLLLTLLSGAACTWLAFAKAERGLWSLVKVSVLAVVAYYAFVLISALALAALFPGEGDYPLFALALMVGYFWWFVIGLLLGWLGRWLQGRRMAKAV
jgi:hypothetical protein